MKHKVTVVVEYMVEAKDREEAYDQTHAEMFRLVKPLDEGYIMQIVVGGGHEEV